MKVKTFTGTHRSAVDQQVNDWLAQSRVVVCKTDVALKPLRSRGWDAVSGRALDRRALAVAISVWYDDEPRSVILGSSRPTDWLFGQEHLTPTQGRRPRRRAGDGKGRSE